MRTEYSCIYEDFVLRPVGEEDPRRKNILSKVREEINDYMQKHHCAFTSADFFIKYSDDFCKHKQDFVNISFRNQLTNAGTKVGTAALSILPVPGSNLAANGINKAVESQEEDKLGKFFHDNATAIQNRLKETFRDWQFKISAAANVLDIEIKEAK